MQCNGALGARRWGVDLSYGASEGRQVRRKFRETSARLYIDASNSQAVQGLYNVVAFTSRGAEEENVVIESKVDVAPCKKDEGMAFPYNKPG